MCCTGGSPELLDLLDLPNRSGVLPVTGRAMIPAAFWTFLFLHEVDSVTPR
jgi:hypothetical protein